MNNAKLLVVDSCALKTKDGQNFCIFPPACLLARERLNKPHLFKNHSLKTTGCRLREECLTSVSDTKLGVVAASDSKANTSGHLKTLFMLFQLGSNVSYRSDTVRFGHFG